ncbi:hypothetical protein CEXT_345681 [Caerostris extrusa]|uniref:Prolactin receptor n=1 Tax=Caerostris extrusa TaxID=172846 RepID=A0AAV4PWV8_CAEEX|nr:hypothetical protein CEXT_345681 [Caerostris extrusa]
MRTNRMEKQTNGGCKLEALNKHVNSPWRQISDIRIPEEQRIHFREDPQADDTLQNNGLSVRSQVCELSKSKNQNENVALAQLGTAKSRATHVNKKAQEEEECSPVPPLFPQSNG